MPHYLPPQARRLGSVTVGLAAQVTSARPVYDTGRFWAVISNLQVKRASATNVSAIYEHPDACCPGAARRRETVRVCRKCERYAKLTRSAVSLTCSNRSWALSDPCRARLMTA